MALIIDMREPSDSWLAWTLKKLLVSGLLLHDVVRRAFSISVNFHHNSALRVIHQESQSERAEAQHCIQH